MKVSVEDISPVKKKLHIEVPVEKVSQEVDAFYEDLRKRAKIKGFRPGKAPRSILERHFKDYVRSEVLQKLVQDTYPRALSETALSPVSLPVFDPQELEVDKPFQYSAIFEIKPDVKVADYFGLVLEGKKEEVTDKEVEERLKGLQNLHAQLKAVSEPRPVQKGDYVIVDYEAFENGKPLEDAKGVNVAVEVGSGHFIPTLEEGMVGLKPEEEKEFEVTWPEDHGYRKWAGKTLTFHLKVKEIKEKTLPNLDDEFAKDLGDYASLEELRARIRQDLQREKDLALDRRLKDQLVDQLVETNALEVPESLVEEQVKNLVSETKTKLASQGLDFRDLGFSEEKLREDYRETARRQVKSFLILERISEQEGITVSDEEIEGRLREIADRTHQKFDVIRRYYEKNGLIPELKARMMTEKTLDLLLEKANIRYA